MVSALPCAGMVTHESIDTDNLIYLLISLHGKRLWRRSVPCSLLKSKLTGHDRCTIAQAMLGCLCLNFILLHTDIFPPASELLTAQALADYFLDKVAKVHTSTLLCPPPTFISHCVTQFDEFLSYKVDFICNVILESPIKPYQLDLIPHALLKLFLPFLHFMCNVSLRDGTLSDCEKWAKIMPILKKPGLDADSASSYRPVSNLTFLSKIIERLVCWQLTSYLHKHCLLSPLHSAYRQHYSNETVSLKVASDIFDSADSGQVTLLSLLDLSAAFDTVDHDILL